MKICRPWRRFAGDQDRGQQPKRNIEDERLITLAGHYSELYDYS